MLRESYCRLHHQAPLATSVPTSRRKPRKASSPFRNFLGFLTALSLALIVTPAWSQDIPTTAYQVGRLWTGDGEPINNAVVLVREGKIVAAGPANSITIPTGSVVHDYSNRVLIPGLIVAETQLGTPAPDEQSVTPHLQVIDGLDLFAEHQALLASGITTFQVTPGTQRIMPGQGAVVKAFGSPQSRILNPTESLQVVLTASAFSPPTVYEPPVGANSEVRPLEPTRPQLASSLAEAVVGLQALWEASQLEPQPSMRPEDRELLTALSGHLKNKNARTRFMANTVPEIRAASLLGERYKLSMTLVDPDYLTQADMNKSNLKRFSKFVLFPAKVSKIENVAIPDPDQTPKAEVWELARWLVEQGRWEDVAIGGLSSSDLTDIFNSVGILQRGGLSKSQILSALTANAAKLLDVNKRVGMIAQGMDADLVFLSGDPWDRGTVVLETVVDGESAYALERGSENRTRETLVKAGSVYTPHGAVAGGQVVVKGTRIASVGQSVSSSPFAEVVEFPGGVVVPGLIDLNTSLGFGSPISDRLELNTKLGDQLMSHDPKIQFVRQSGITTALVSSSRSPSPVLAFKLSDRPRLLKDPVAIRVDVVGNLTSVGESLRRTMSQAKSYAESWTKYEADLATYQIALKAYEAEIAKQKAAEEKAAEEKAKQDQTKASAETKTDALESAENKSGNSGSNSAGSETPKAESTKPSATTTDLPKSEGGATPDDGAKATDSKTTDNKTTEAKSTETSQAKGPEKPTEPTKPREVANLEPYRGVFAGKIPVIANAKDSRSIELAIKIFAEEFQVQTIIAGAEDVEPAAEWLRRPKVFVAAGPELMPTKNGTALNVPQFLATEGIRFGFQSNAETGAALLPQVVAAATYQGLSPDDALQAFTSASADCFQLGTVGQISAGRDADLVVLSGSPFDLGTEVWAVMIDGEWVYRKDHR